MIEGSSLEGKKIVHISVGEYQTFALTSDGLLHFWGPFSNSGSGYNSNQLVARLVDLSNVPAGQKPTFLSTFSGSLRGMVVGGSLPVKFCDDLICGDGDLVEECSGHGDCVAVDQCVCSANYTGLKCENPICSENTQAKSVQSQCGKYLSPLKPESSTQL